MRNTICLLFLAFAVASCDRDESRRVDRSSQPRLRIASFSPALTSTVAALGWSGNVVGRTPWCESSAPIVGSLHEVDLEALASVGPNLILIQRTQSGAPEQLEKAALSKNWRLESIPATSLDDILRLPGAVARAVGQPPPNNPQLLVEALESQLTRCPEALALSPAVLLYSDDPIGAFGADSYLAQAWKAMGGTLAISNKGNPNVSLEELFAMRPKSILLITGSGARNSNRSGILGEPCESRGVSLLTVRAPQLLLPGPELVEGLRILRSDMAQFRAVQPRSPNGTPSTGTTP